MCNSDVFGQLPGVSVGVICNILQIKIVKQTCQWSFFKDSFKKCNPWILAIKQKILEDLNNKLEDPSRSCLDLEYCHISC